MTSSIRLHVLIMMLFITQQCSVVFRGAKFSLNYNIGSLLQCYIYCSSLLQIDVFVRLFKKRLLCDALFSLVYQLMNGKLFRQRNQ